MVVDKDGAISYKLVGAKAENGKTRQMNELEQQQLNDYINSISFGVTVQDDGTVTPQ
jgi:protein involved in polysaccharide export with SLBB domain